MEQERIVFHTEFYIRNYKYTIYSNIENNLLGIERYRKSNMRLQFLYLYILTYF